MRIKQLPWILSSVAIMLLSGYTMIYPNGAPAAKTGSPGDGASCSQCHNQAATTTTGQITSNIPASGYVPGQTYQITATNPLTGSGKYGFEVSPQNVAGTLLGTLVAGSGNKLVGNSKYVTQSNANSTTKTWTFSWIAPVAGTGAVTFYGAFARNYTGPTTLSTLVVQEASAAPAPAGPIAGPVAVCKNNTQTYSISAIPGATSYVWTVPSGATILSGQGTTLVSISFGSTAVSGNVSVYGTNGTGNGAASDLLVSVNTVPESPTQPAGPALVNLQNTFISDYSTSAGADFYVWQLSPTAAGTISGTTASAQVTWNIAFSGTAEITVKGQNSCGEGTWSPVTTTQVLNTTGMGEDNYPFRIISGESNGYFTLVMNANASQGRLMVMDLSGRVLVNTIIAGQGTQQISHQLKTGVYIVVVEAGNTSLTKKILII